MNAKLETVITVVLTASALTMAGVMVRRELHPQAAATTAGGRAPLVKDTMFVQALRNGTRVGRNDAKVQIVEFGDLECPACRGFHTELETVRKEFPNDIALTYVHFPLSMHRFALPAARAADCASDRGRFGEFISLVYQKQDSLGLKSWGSFALEAGIADSAAIAACANAKEVPPRVQLGRTLGRGMDVGGTPTVLINGWRYSNTPTAEVLRGVVQRVLAGHDVAGSGQ